MGELLDKLERASKGTVQPLGFGGANRREQVAPILLLGAVVAGDDAQAKLVGDAKLDGAIVIGSDSAKKADVEKSTKSLKGTTIGVWQEEAQAKDPTGSDFQVFSADSTAIASLSGDERTNVMQVIPELDDSLLRTIEHLPVDAFLVSLADAESLTVAQFMRLARVRGVTSRWILAHLRTLPSKEEMEQLREAGVSGLVVDVAGQTKAALEGCLAMLVELPHEAPERNKRHVVATLPTISAPGASAPAAPEPDDDDDWEDD
jgi:hypothetical protein